MKTISLWATAIVSSFFVIIGCIDSRNWKLLGACAGIWALWTLCGWYWLHRAELKRDLSILANCSSPLKCQWIGTLILFAIIVLVLLIMVIGALYFIVSQLIKLL